MQSKQLTGWLGSINKVLLITNMRLPVPCNAIVGLKEIESRKRCKNTRNRPITPNNGTVLDIIALDE